MKPILPRLKDAANRRDVDAAKETAEDVQDAHKGFRKALKSPGRAASIWLRCMRNAVTQAPGLRKLFGKRTKD